MRRFAFVFTLFFALFLHADGHDASCKGCGAGKLMLQCDYYVARKGDLSKRRFCAEYAKVVDIDGASAKAAWYWLLAGEPEKAFDAGMRAYRQGQTFAAGYVAQALAVLGNGEEARNFMKKFEEAVAERGYFDREIATLQRLYPSVDFSVMKSLKK